VAVHGTHTKMNWWRVTCFERKFVGRNRTTYNNSKNARQDSKESAARHGTGRTNEVTVLTVRSKFKSLMTVIAVKLFNAITS
jgi:hypothetical protein